MLSYNESDGKEEQNRSAKHLASLFFVLRACFSPRLAIALFFLFAARRKALPFTTKKPFIERACGV